MKKNDPTSSARGTPTCTVTSMTSEKPEDNRKVEKSVEQNGNGVELTQNSTVEALKISVETFTRSVDKLTCSIDNLTETLKSQRS